PVERGRDRPLRLAGIGVGAVGVVSLVVGISFGALAHSDRDELSHPTAGTRFDPALEERLHRDQALSASFLVLAGLAVATGATLLVLGWPKRSGAQAALIPSLGAHEAQLIFRSAF